MSTTRLRNMSPVWLNSTVEHISRSLPDEQRNIIKKGWDQLYLEPIGKEGFLETGRAAHEVTMQERLKEQDKLKFKEQTASSIVMYNFGVGPRFAYVSASSRAPK